jgi:ADP-ribosyl-[dinitrogen reductase] hydrolase
LDEANRRARISGISTVKYWFENDIEIDDNEMPIPHYRPISYIKTAILWTFYYLKKGFTYEDAMEDILMRGGDTQGNAAIVGGLLGAA